MKKSKKLLKLEKDLFKMVWDWGGLGIVANHESKAYQDMLEKMYSIAYDEGWTDADLWIKGNTDNKMI